MKNKKMEMATRQVFEYLGANRFQQCYEGVATAVWGKPSAARAVGSCMNALGKRGFDELCRLVVKKEHFNE